MCSKRHKLAMVVFLSKPAELWKSYPDVHQPKPVVSPIVRIAEAEARQNIGSFVPCPQEFRRAVARVRGQIDQRVDTVPNVPSRKVAANEAVLDAQGGQFVDDRGLLRRLVFCAAEAQREDWRKAIKEADVVCICHDKRAAELLVLFNCCRKSDLSVTRGVIDLMHAPKSSAGNIKLYLQKAVANFCTRYFAAPGVGQSEEFDADLARCLFAKTRGAFADGAPADQKALSALRTRKDLFSFLQDTGRDKGHAATSSVIKRPWSVLSDSALKFSQALVTGKQSAVRIIQYSPAHKSIWKENALVTASSLSTQVDDLNYAKQRFSSVSSPYARIALMPSRFFKSCSDIAFERAHCGEGKQMASLLRSITDEHLVMTGLLATAAQQGLAFVRQLDKFRIESERLTEFIERYLEEMDAVFGKDGAAFGLHSSKNMLVHYIYEFLLEPRVFAFPGGTTTVGGRKVWEDVPLMSRCKAELATYLAASRAGLKTEFPFWETAQAFRAFDVNYSRIKPGATLCLQRIGSRFGLSCEELTRQFQAARPLAVRRYQALRCNRGAWVEAARSIERRQRSSYSTLREALSLWCCETFSTCGVEHAFTHQARLFGSKLRSRANISKRRDEFTVVFSDRSLNDFCLAVGGLMNPEGVWATESQTVWRKLYPQARRRLVVRSDAGGTKVARKGTLCSALKKARSAIRKAARKRKASGSSQGEATQQSGPSAVSTKLKRELDLQQKRLAEKVRAAAAEKALPQEDAEHPDIARILSETSTNSGKAAAAKRRLPQVQVDAPPAKRGAPLTSGLLSRVVVSRLQKDEKYVFAEACGEEFRSRLLSNGLMLTRDRLRADVIVTNITSDGPRLDKMAAWLTGARLVDQNWLSAREDGKPLPATMKYAAAVSIRRLWLYFTPGIRSSRPSACALIDEAATLPFSRWTVLKSESAFKGWLSQRPKNCFSVYVDQHLSSLSVRPKGSIGWSEFLLGIQRYSRKRSNDGLVLPLSAAQVAAVTPA